MPHDQSVLESCKIIQNGFLKNFDQDHIEKLGSRITIQDFLKFMLALGQTHDQSIGTSIENEAYRKFPRHTAEKYIKEVEKITRYFEEHAYEIADDESIYSQAGEGSTETSAPEAPEASEDL